jgi:hypothetical protein
MNNKRLTPVTRQLHAWQLVLTEFNNPQICPCWLQAKLPGSPKSNRRLLKKNIKTALATTGIALQIDTLHDQLQCNPKLSVWFDSNANIQVAVDYDGENFDVLYASDFDMQTSPQGLDCSSCTGSRYWTDPLSLWRQQVMLDFIRWCERLLLGQDSLVLYACFDEGNRSSEWSGATTRAQLGNKDAVTAKNCVGIFPLWQPDQVVQGPLSLICDLKQQEPKTQLTDIAEELLNEQLEIMQTLADK